MVAAQFEGCSESTALHSRALCTRTRSRAASTLIAAIPSPTNRSGQPECVYAVTNPTATIARFAMVSLRAERNAARVSLFQAHAFRNPLRRVKLRRTERRKVWPFVEAPRNQYLSVRQYGHRVRNQNITISKRNGRCRFETAHGAARGETPLPAGGVIQLSAGQIRDGSVLARLAATADGDVAAEILIASISRPWTWTSTGSRRSPTQMRCTRRSARS